MPAKKWDDRFYLQAYRLAMAGLTDSAIAERIGVAPSTFLLWAKEREALANALAEGRRRDGRGVMRFKRSVYDRMPAAARELWDEINSPKHDRRKAALFMLKDGGRKVRQQLFLLALAENNFGASAARAAVGVRPEEWELWKQDARFLSLLAEVDEAKKDFFEGALFDLVAQGEPSAVIHANKTKNRDRGYGERVEVEHTVTVRDQTVQAMLSGLSVEDRRTMLEIAARARRPRVEVKTSTQSTPPGPVIEAEVVDAVKEDAT